MVCIMETESPEFKRNDARSGPIGGVLRKIEAHGLPAASNASRGAPASPRVHPRSVLHEAADRPRNACPSPSGSSPACSVDPQQRRAPRHRFAVDPPARRRARHLPAPPPHHPKAATAIPKPCQLMKT
uniref:Uncharacterized protein n=1 Tax=Ralstonia solanacearum CFBP2957 TaxID=859656 RepID=D8P313_RALSL|nr:protein of unknown function [Ralstonia solanacearum CFBP2957]